MTWQGKLVLRAIFTRPPPGLLGGDFNVDPRDGEEIGPWILDNVLQG